MSEKRKRILEMLAGGKITVEEAERLLSALSSGATEKEQAKKSKPKYLRVIVEPATENANGEWVNVRVPLSLIRAGMKWAAFIPRHARGKVEEAFKEKGIDVDFGRIKPEDLEEIFINLDDLQVEVDGKERVRVYCE